MPLTIWNCVLSYKQKNYSSENWLVMPRNYGHKRIFRWQLFATLIFNRWQMGSSGNLPFATVNLEP